MPQQQHQRCLNSQIEIQSTPKWAESWYVRTWKTDWNLKELPSSISHLLYFHRRHSIWASEDLRTDDKVNFTRIQSSKLIFLCLVLLFIESDFSIHSTPPWQHTRIDWGLYLTPSLPSLSTRKSRASKSFYLIFNRAPSKIPFLLSSMMRNYSRKNPHSSFLLFRGIFNVVRRTKSSLPSTFFSPSFIFLFSLFVYAEGRTKKVRSLFDNTAAAAEEGEKKLNAW